jgi:hypothetical protein
MMKPGKQLIKGATAVGVLSLIASGNPAKADAGILDGYEVFGIDGQSNDLVKYRFCDQNFQNLGHVHFDDGATAAGIKGMAYVPDVLNFYGFWKDPSSNLTKLVYINSETALATVVGQDIGTGEVTGATIAWLRDDIADLNNGHGNDCDGVDEGNPGNSTGVNLNGMGNGAHGGINCQTQLGIFALQTIEVAEDLPLPFHISEGYVVPDAEFAAKISVLGASITNTASTVPVTLQITVGTTIIEPFGDPTKPVDANINDQNNPRNYILSGVNPSGTQISIKAASWIKKQSYYSGLQNNHWQTFIVKDSHGNSANVKVLRNGDNAPNYTSFSDTNVIRDFVRDYVDLTTQKMVLDENQAIFLFELGTNDLTSAGADFDDLVVMVTLDEDPNDLVDLDDDDATVAPAARLIKVDVQTGGVQQMMNLNHIYDGLTAAADGTFYATFAQQLYKIDVFTQIETLVGDLPNSEVKGFESAGSTFCGFSTQTDRLVPIDILTGAAIDSPMDVMVGDLQTIVFKEATDITVSAGCD